MKYFKLLLALVLLSIVSGQLSDVTAQSMSNSSYILQGGGFNSFSGRSTGSQNTVTSTGGSLAPGIYQGNNYIVRTNYLYGQSSATNEAQLQFSISNSNINFGKITAGDPIIRTNTLLISSPNSGYQVTVSENRSLTNPGGVIIPDTSCDAGNCTENTAAIWQSPLTYGLGYRCDNLEATDCSSQFRSTNFYMPFPNITSSETPFVFMSNISPSATSEAQITYKLNIPGTQATGIYQNVIQYIASPSL